MYIFITLLGPEFGKKLLLMWSVINHIYDHISLIFSYILTNNNTLKFPKNGVCYLIMTDSVIKARDNWFPGPHESLEAILKSRGVG